MLKMDTEIFKTLAAERALELVRPGMKLGLGSGSTSGKFIQLLGAKVKAGLDVVCVPTSEDTRILAERAGIKLTTLDEFPELDLTVDGADEVDGSLRLIKGGGGALLREKIVAAVARKFVCIADASKLVGVLGKFPLPVEVIPMARSYVARQLVLLGGQPAWRMGFATDNGNVILDVHNLSIVNPGEMEARIRAIVGVVTVGLFAARGADVILLGTDAGVLPHGSNANELVTLQNLGMTPLQALRAATTTAAECLGLPADYVSLKVGAPANFIAVSGDPLVDLKALLTPAAVVMRGKALVAPGQQRGAVPQ